MVVETHLESGRPVPSKAISGLPGFDWSPSTVRSELAALEAAGFLTHPHTSAGRVPTDSGYRFYADELLAGPPTATGGPGIGIASGRYEITEVMREATASLARITDMLALATAPPASVARIHRIEALQLQPSVAMVVVIASDGEVARRVFRFDAALDSGLVDWASSYLNERLGGLPVGARITGDRLRGEGLGPAEEWFLSSIAPAFAEIPAAAEGDLYLEGTSRLLAEHNAGSIPDPDSVIEALERRGEVIQALRASVNRRPVFCWIGSEGHGPELGRVSVVGAGYGLGYRNLGAVGVVGPVRMDYATAIANVRAAAGELSRFFESVYES